MYKIGELKMQKKYPGVFKTEHGDWAYRYTKVINGKTISRKRYTDDFGKPFKTAFQAHKARESSINKALLDSQNITNHKKSSQKRTMNDVFTEYCDKGRKGKAYATIRKQDSLWNVHLKERFGNKYVDGISVAEIIDYLSELYYEKGYSYRYVESFLNNTYQYYDINKQSDLEYYQFDEFLQEEDEEGTYTYFYVKHPRRFETARYVIHQVVLATQKTPLLNIFTSLGMLPWIMVFFLLYNLWRGRRRDLALLAVPFLTIAVCLVSPDNGNSRYVMPMFYLLPFLFALELLPGEDEQNGEMEIKPMEEKGERE